MGTELRAVPCGRVAYPEALGWQRLLAAERRQGAIPDTVLLLEHDPVYTAGRHADVARHVLRAGQIPLVSTDRGGDVTYHGPGQLVAYPILELAHGKAVRAYVEALESAAVRTAAVFGVDARPDRRRTGVWVGEDKLVAIGIRVDRAVTTHGLAFNVTTDLDDYAGIVPCGIRDGGVCSLASLDVTTTVADVAPVLAAALADALGSTLVWTERSDLVHTAG